MNRVKKIACFVAMFLMVSAFVPVLSADASTPKAVNSIQPHADKIVTKYRTYNGVRQYRRWNETKGCWVDPATVLIHTIVISILSNNLICPRLYSTSCLRCTRIYRKSWC